MQTTDNPGQHYFSEQTFAKTREVLAVSQDFVTVLGKQNEVLEKHKTRFENVYSSVFDVLKGKFRECGYHCWKKHELEEPVIESNHPVEHAKAGVVRLTALRRIITRDSEFADPKEEVSNVFGKSDNESINSSSYDKLKSLLEDEINFNNLAEDQILISLVHDVAEVKGRKGHEDAAQRFILELIQEYPERFRHFQTETYTIVDDAGNTVEMSRLDYILLGIDGSKIATTVPPELYESDFTVIGKSGKSLHTIPRDVANSLMGRMARVITETSDWERISAPEYCDSTFLDESLDGDPNKLREALLNHPALLLAAEGLIEDRFAYLAGSESASNIRKYGGIVPLLEGNFKFYNEFVRSKMDKIDGWIEKTRLGNLLLKRFGLFDTASCTRITAFSAVMMAAKDDLLMRRAYQAALLLLSNGECSVAELANMNIEELKSAFYKVKEKGV